MLVGSVELNGNIISSELLTESLATIKLCSVDRHIVQIARPAAMYKLTAVDVACTCNL